MEPREEHSAYEKAVFFILIFVLWGLNSYQLMIKFHSLSPLFFVEGFGATIVSALVWASIGYIVCQIAAFFIHLARPERLKLSLWQKMSAGIFLGLLVKIIWNVRL
jgi:hypothetical protein